MRFLALPAKNLRRHKTRSVLTALGIAIALAIVTHDAAVSKRARRMISLLDGRIVQATGEAA